MFNNDLFYYSTSFHEIRVTFIALKCSLTLEYYVLELRITRISFNIMLDKNVRTLVISSIMSVP